MSIGDIVVFLGPSLPRHEAAAILPATYLRRRNKDRSCGHGLTISHVRWC